MNVSGLYCVSNKVLGCWDTYKAICDNIRSLLSMRRWSKGNQFRSFRIAVTLEMYL